MHYRWTLFKKPTLAIRGCRWGWQILLSRFGEIVVDHHGATNLHGVFAAGDATTVPYKQIVIAAGDGAKAALGAFDYLIRSSAPPVEAAAA